MFQFRRFPSYTYVFSVWWLDMTPAGLLHSEICGSMSTYDSPQLIAVSCVLHRLSVPRHSPCALCSLTMWLSWFFFLNSKNCSRIKFYLTIFLSFRFICFSLFSFQSAKWSASGFRFLLFTLYSLRILVGLSGLEPPTSRLSGVRSNRLSYKPIGIWSFKSWLLAFLVFFSEHWWR